MKKHDSGIQNIFSPKSKIKGHDEQYWEFLSVHWKPKHSRVYLEPCLNPLFVCLFVTEVTHLSVKTGSERGSYANPLCQITAITAESFAAPVLDVFLTPLYGLKSQHVMRDTALEFGPPSGTGKLIPLLLDAGTYSCTRFPPSTDGIFPHLTHGHASFTVQVWPMS